MGLFDLFKKKQEKKQPDMVIAELEVAEDIVEVAKVLAENKIISKPKDKNHNTFGEDLRHLTADGELPFGWVAYNKDIVEQIDSELSTFRNRIYEAKDKKERLSALQSYFQYLEDGKKHYCHIGECAGKYFEEYAIDSEETRGNKRKLNQLKAELKA